MSNLLYRINGRPRTFRERLGYSLQVVFSCITATLLISLICGTDLTAGMVAAGISTIFFLFITKFHAPIVISNSGATASAVIGALTLTDSVQKNFLGVIIGGATIMIIYGLAALLVRHYGTEQLTKLITPLMSGAIILIISIQLGFFIPTYAQVNNQYSIIGIGVAFFSLFITLLCAFYGKRYMQRWPILFGVLAGYALSAFLTLLHIYPLVDFSYFRNVHILHIPNFAFLHISFRDFDQTTMPQILVSFALVALGSLAEHIGDIINASNICERDLLTDPGLSRTLLGDGIGSFIGTIIGGQPNTTYTENLSAILISKCASVYITLLAAIELILLALLGPFNAFLQAMPRPVFAGASICCYGMIGASAIQYLFKQHINFSDPKNMQIFAIMLMVGTSGISVQVHHFSLTGICLAIIIGIVLNVLLPNKRRGGMNYDNSGS